MNAIKLNIVNMTNDDAHEYIMSLNLSIKEIKELHQYINTRTTIVSDLPWLQ